MHRPVFPAVRFADVDAHHPGFALDLLVSRRQDLLCPPWLGRLGDSRFLNLDHAGTGKLFEFPEQLVDFLPGFDKLNFCGRWSEISTKPEECMW